MFFLHWKNHSICSHTSLLPLDGTDQEPKGRLGGQGGDYKVAPRNLGPADIWERSHDEEH